MELVYVSAAGRTRVCCSNFFLTFHLLLQQYTRRGMNHTFVQSSGSVHIDLRLRATFRLTSSTCSDPHVTVHLEEFVHPKVAKQDNSQLPCWCIVDIMTLPLDQYLLYSFPPLTQCSPPAANMSCFQETFDIPGWFPIHDERTCSRYKCRPFL